MPAKATKIKTSTIKPYDAVIGQGSTGWRPGVISLVSEARMPLGGVLQAKNMMQTEDGVWATRWGSKNYGTSFPNSGTAADITAFEDYTIYNSDGSHTSGVVIMCKGQLYKSADGGSWTLLDAHAFNTSVWTNILQYENKLLLANGVDNFTYYDLNTSSLHTFTALAAPGTVTATPSSGLTSGATTPIYYAVTAVSDVGETLPSATVTASVNLARDNWYNPSSTTVSSSSPNVALSFAAVTNAVAYNVYASVGAVGNLYYLDTVYPPSSGTTVTYTDYGINAINTFSEVPTSDTTTAPKFSWIALSDNRLWACGDPNHPNRIYWAATGDKYATTFSPALGGGWVDIMPGGPQRPAWVGQFRDGKGDPMTTILQTAPSGYGSTWHVAIQSQTIGTTNISVPTLMQSMGTFGTQAPRAVIETNQNVYFYSGGPGGIYSTGSIATLFNVLATNEISIMVRPDIKTIDMAQAVNMDAIEFDRKLFFSVPYGSVSNNRIMVYDTEKQNWNPYAFDFGVKRFVRYTDSSGNLHLLAIPMTGNSMLEISDQYLDDNNVPFNAHLQTGMVFCSPDHVQYAHVNYVYYEFGTPQGTITVNYDAAVKGQPLKPIVSVTKTLGTSASNAGFSTYAFSAEPFSYASSGGSTEVYSEPAEFGRLRVNKLLRSWEAEVFSDAAATRWTLNQVVVTGQMVPTADASRDIWN